jgi:D-sedoheptulose 7-phosphate isomerase
MAEPAANGQADSAFRDEVARFLTERRTQLPEVLARLEESSLVLAHMADRLVETLRTGNTILTVGNGGSAAEAQHFAAELVGRFRRDRAPYAAIALTTDTSILTALGNDYGFDDVFARQVRALAREGDVLLAFSTSGESENLVRAAEAAHDRGVQVISLTGSRPNRLDHVSDLAQRVPSEETPIVQEVHLMITHLLCGLIEESLASDCEPAGESRSQIIREEER